MSSIIELLAALILLSSSCVCFGQHSVESLSFSSEDEKVANFVQLPQEILSLLVNDKEDFPDSEAPSLHCEGHEEPTPEPQPQILCRTVPLSSQTGADFLVIGVGGLRGAHIVPFWLFHQDGNRAPLLLKTRSDQIEITPKRFNGHAEVRSTWIQGAGATIVTDTFRFNGKIYVRTRRETQHQ
jgi:hypothetical protein